MIERFAQMYATWMFPTIVLALLVSTIRDALRDRSRGAK